MRNTLLGEMLDSLMYDVMGSCHTLAKETNPVNFRKEFELPGIKKEEVAVEHDGLNLWIRIDSKRLKRSLSYKLPSSVYNVDEITVTMSDGLLDVSVPLKEKTPEIKKISIK